MTRPNQLSSLSPLPDGLSAISTPGPRQVRDVVPTSAAARSAFVSLRGVSFSYPGRGGIGVLSGVDLDLQRGEFFVLLGPSGCGKTTVLNMLAGFERASSGEIVVGGRPVQKPDPSRIVIFQGDDSLLGWLTAIENIEFGLRVQRVQAKERRARAEEALSLVGLAG